MGFQSKPDESFARSASSHLFWGWDHVEQASEENRESIVAEFVDFLKYNKKWWLTPIVLVLLVLVALLALAGPGSAVAPFIYTLF
jgi:hypothetical protein